LQTVIGIKVNESLKLEICKTAPSISSKTLSYTLHITTIKRTMEGAMGQHQLT